MIFSRRVLLCFVIFSLTFLVCSCDLISNKQKIKERFGDEIYDKNGKGDYSLALLAEDDITSECYYYCQNYSTLTSGAKSATADTKANIKNDADTVTVTAESEFNGVDVVQGTYGKVDALLFTV